MKTQLLMLGAASLILAAGAAHAELPSSDQLYLSVVGLQANARLARAGLLPAEEHLRVRATLSGNRLDTIRVSPSTGDAKTDQAIRRELGRMAIALPPAELDHQEITVTVGPVTASEARVP